jgi:hypothetical protein
MPKPVVVVSHFKIKEGKLDGLKKIFPEVLETLKVEKPRTTAQLAYVDEAGTRVSIVHVFADADVMDQHFERAEERTKTAYEFMDPAGWEIYGTPSVLPSR